MLYQKYRKRVNKISWFLQMLVKYRVAVIGGLAALCATVTGFIAVSGAIVGGEECPQVIEYGQEIDYDVSALMGDVTIEYAIDDGTGTYRWSAVKPYKTGNYVIRARSDRAFGITEYGEEFKFSIVAKPIDVKANAEKETIYGDLPELVGDLFPEDCFSCDEFEIEDKNALETSVTPIASAVKITDKDGEDVTYCYKINVLPETITFTPRPITVESASATKVYDGKELNAKEISISDGNCVYDQTVVSVSYKENIKDVGTSDNTISEARILSVDGTDVTENYAINYKFGKLTITKRPIKIITSSAEKVYDGEPLTCSDYVAEYVYPEDYDGERNLTALPDGQIFSIKEAFSSIVNVKESGKINSVIFDITDGENNVTDNYDISYAYGTLAVTKRPLFALTETETFEYDGTAHFNSGVSFINDTSLANLHSYKAIENTVKQIVNAADSKENNNIFAIEIYDKDDNNVTENYEIEYEYGTLTVTPRPITITTLSDSKVYDGKPLTYTNYTDTHTNDDSKDAFINGATLSVSESASITAVGEITNEFTSYEIINGDARNYKITLNEVGKLTVTKRPLTVFTASEFFEYDGVPHSNDGVSFNDTSLADGQEYAITTTTLPNVTNVSQGEVENEFTLKITDGNGNDVTENYNISYEYGTLKITPRKITIATGTKEKVYDGNPLTCTDYTAKYTGNGTITQAFINGASLQVNASTSITNVQRDGSGNVISVENEFTSYEIEGDEASNYDITFDYGTLKITPIRLTITTESATKEYDGTYLKKEKYTLTCTDEPSKNFSWPSHERLKFTSGFKSIKNVEKVDNKFTYEIEGGLLSNYEFKEEWGTLEITPRPITVESDSKTKEYDGTELSCYAKDTITVTYNGTYATTEPFASGEDYTVISHTERIHFGTSDNVIKIKITDSENIDVTENYKIEYVCGTLEITKRPIKITTYGAEKVYDGTALTKEGYVAEYIGNSTVNNTTALVSGDEFKNIKYTEIYDVQRREDGEFLTIENMITFEISGIGKKYDYDIAYECGFLTMIPRPITITTGSATKIYDGKKLTCMEYIEKYTGDNSKPAFAEGEELDVKESKSIINVEDGEVENKFIKYVIKGGRGKLSNYDITFVCGKLKITPRPITITTGTKEKVYDGKKLTCTDYDEVYTGDSSKKAFADGEELDVKESTSITDVGEIINEFTSYAIKNGKLSNYTITLKNTGKLKVTPRPIVIITGSAEKVYDGKPLTCTDYTTVYFDGEKELNGFVGSEKIIVKESTSITDVGSVDNVFTDYEIENITLGNYDITFDYGTLKITKRKITLTAGSETKKHDGEPLTNDVISVTGEGLVDGDELKGVKTVGSQTEIGKSENKIDSPENIKIVSEDGTDVTDNYEIEIKDGTLEVTEKDPDDGNDNKTDDDNGNKTDDDDNNKKNDDDNGNSGSGANSIGPSQYGNKGNKNSEQVGWIVSGVNEVVYLKDQSWGDYVDNQWQKFETVFDGKIDGKYSFDDLVSYVLQLKDNAAKSGLTSETAKSGLTVDLGGSYYKPQYVVLGSKKSGSATQYEVSHYNVSKYSYLLENNIALDDKSLDDVYYIFVKNNYLNVSESTKAFLKEFMTENGINSLDDVVSYMTTQMTYNLLYDTSIDSEDDVVKALLSNEKYKKQGVCYHFATAATLMLRTLGIPARMTSGYMVECKANTETEILRQNAHGWVEVYIENLGWITVEVTPARDLNAELETLKEILTDYEITLIAPDDFKLYDGTPLTAPQSCKIDDETKALFDKYEITHAVTAKVDGSVTEGTTESVITSYTLKLSYNGLTIDEVYKVKKQNGKLEVIKKDVVTVYIITSCTEYDGKSHEFTDDDRFLKTGLPEGYTIEVKLSKLGSITNVGSLDYKRLYEYTTIKDINGKDVTEDYFVKFVAYGATAQEKIVDTNHSFCFGENGLITITKRKLKVTSMDADAEYKEGSTLRYEKYSVTGDLAEGHTMEVLFTGERTAPGTSANSFTVKIYDARGKDVTSNYEITPIFGTLTLEGETL